MKITFIPLSKNHFPLLLKWLNTPHVKKFWDEDIVWTLAKISEKYESYTRGYKREDGYKKTIKAYIILSNDDPVGYIQIYNAYDFRRSKPLHNLPEKLAAIDILIGEEKYLNQGIGSMSIETFLDGDIGDYSHVFVGPDMDNISAIKAYEKAGFIKIQENLEEREIWMLREIKND